MTHYTGGEAITVGVHIEPKRPFNIIEDLQVQIHVRGAQRAAQWRLAKPAERIVCAGAERWNVKHTCKHVRSDGAGGRLVPFIQPVHHFDASRVRGMVD